MKKILFFILPVLLLSCTKDDKPSTPIYTKPGKNVLSMPFSDINYPKYKKEEDYMYLTAVDFESEEIEGFTKIDHNKFQANETKEYKFEMLFNAGLDYSPDIVAPPIREWCLLLIKVDNKLVYSVKTNNANSNGSGEKYTFEQRLKKYEALSFWLVAPYINDYTLKRLFISRAFEIKIIDNTTGQADFANSKQS